MCDSGCSRTVSQMSGNKGRTPAAAVEQLNNADVARCFARVDWSLAWSGSKTTTKVTDTGRQLRETDRQSMHRDKCNSAVLECFVGA